MQVVQQTTPAGPPAHAPMPGDAGARLLALARESRSTATDWAPGMDWARARNAHRTNTAAELEAALRSDANWLEGDIRRDPTSGALVMAHDRTDVGRGLSLDAWLAAGRASGRGVKAELKEPASFDAYVAAIERSGIEQSRLILNVPVAASGDQTVLADSELVELRRRLPDATINLSPTGHDSYTPAMHAELARAARLVGGPVMFPLQWDLLDDATIGALRPHGRVAVWASQGWGVPRDAVAEADALRERGVDGMVDLGSPNSLGARIMAAAARGLGAVFGRSAVVDARDAVVGWLR